MLKNFSLFPITNPYMYSIPKSSPNLDSFYTHLSGSLC